MPNDRLAPETKTETNMCSTDAGDLALNCEPVAVVSPFRLKLGIACPLAVSVGLGLAVTLQLAAVRLDPLWRHSPQSTIVATTSASPSHRRMLDVRCAPEGDIRYGTA